MSAAAQPRGCDNLDTIIARVALASKPAFGQCEPRRPDLELELGNRLIDAALEVIRCSRLRPLEDQACRAVACSSEFVAKSRRGRTLGVKIRGGAAQGEGVVSDARHALFGGRRRAVREVVREVEIDVLDPATVRRYERPAGGVWEDGLLMDLADELD